MASSSEERLKEEDTGMIPCMKLDELSENCSKSFITALLELKLSQTALILSGLQ
jgi:hypothetical protein